MDAWEVVHCTEDMSVLKSPWEFKLKCIPDRLMKKFKTQFCVRGDQQIENINIFETYAPVAQ